MNRGRTALLVAALVAGCGQAPKTGVEGDPSRIASSWPMRLATDLTLHDAELQAYARWVGAGSGDWAPPGAVGAGSTAARARADDGEAVARFALVATEASCQLGRTPDALGGLAAALELAARACTLLGDAPGAHRARGQISEAATESSAPDAAALGLDAAGLDAAAPPPVASPSPGALATALLPALDLELRVAGEVLRYRFLDPGLGESARALLPPAAPGSSLVDLVGTTRWTPEDAAVAASPVAASAVAASHVAASHGAAASPTSALSLAARELALASALRQWQADLDATPSLDAATRTAVLHWVRRALAASSGAAAVLGGDPAAGLVLLEEAVGGGRPRPGPGLDPVLLSWLALARWRAGELRGAAELLADVGAQPGWEFAGVAAELVARVAVIPSETDSRVRR